MADAALAQELPREGLSWTWDLDVEALLAALREPAPWSSSARSTVNLPPGPVSADLASAHVVPAEVAPAEAESVEADPVEAEFAEILSAMEGGRSRVVPLTTVAGRVAEALPTGPDLAGWLATGAEDQLEDGALVGVAASYRRLASWAQAGELAAVAELASRSASADERIGTDEQGRPARLPDEACAQVSLALTMSHSSATWWSDLAVTLKWRLPATGAALRSGAIDLGRARAIAEATALLDDEKARKVEGRVLPGAGNQTMAQLRAALRRAVIMADPRGAERRRLEAERRAKVMLYPGAEGTASLVGYSLPGVSAAAAMARISALARALKASGAGGGIDLLRAQVLIGLLLGTLPHIPPSADGPPGSEPPEGGSPGQEPSPGGLPGAEGRPEADVGRDPSSRRRSASRSEAGTTEGRPHGGCPPDVDEPRPGVPRARPGIPDDLNGVGLSEPHEDGTDDGDRGWAGDYQGGVPTGGFGNGVPDGVGADDDDTPWARPPPTWPELPVFLRSAPIAVGDLRPGGMLDLKLSWGTLIGAEPGYLGPLGPITPTQARQLAEIAAGDPAADWRVVVTGPDNRALSVGRIPRKLARAGPAGLVKRVTVSIRREQLAQPVADLPPALARVLSAAERAIGRVDARTPATARDRCAHAEETSAYRPSPWLREFVIARDQTCRFLTCRQPAWRCDLDHTEPYDRGGRTCDCNLGCLCRFHHQLKQHRRWQLIQPTPGTFAWITPTGRTYATLPDSYAA